MPPPIDELTDRMREIFGLVVESYLDRGLPIGSKVLAGSINLSPASIRGVMQELEERGLLTHPHTSAGRIPTESGLRLFVDGIMQAAVPNLSERREIERQIVRDQPIEDALAAASAALSGLSQAAGVVLAPKRELTLKQLTAAFTKFNIKQLNPQGEKFDPHLHQAMCMVESEFPHNTVVQVMQKGYVLNDRVLRPALVSVSKGKES